MILKWTKMELKLSKKVLNISSNDTEMVSPPIHIPGVNKSLLSGGKQIKKKHMVDDFHDESFKM